MNDGLSKRLGGGVAEHGEGSDGRCGLIDGVVVKAACGGLSGSKKRLLQL